ncbi:hypothetical protein PoB_003584000 [Plakobranchus ocellatus]|uniref:Uncharacterized protein n=1 Tax=Plakobranchus ocellatus TaxID=259542 RepID=A0AAV4APP8_9GAST|nr:hypothetical protein PoB_003584000 [Plakobranchus ocellatus]
MHVMQSLDRYNCGAKLESNKETSRGRDRKSAGGDSKLENANLVSQVNKDDGGQAHTSKAINKTRFSPLGSGSSSSITSKAKSDGLRLIREKMKTRCVTHFTQNSYEQLAGKNTEAI